LKKLSHSIILIAFFLQTLIPVGFMPVFASDGTTITICSGITGEPKQIQLDDAPADNHEDKSVSYCSYFGIGTYTCVSTSVLVKLDPSYVLSNTGISEIFIQQSVYLSNQSRGPPHFSLT
tara:strand:- start:107 stop:466 length:360 start_codon:yes stop_codon:yes gene_type:complete